MEKAGAGFKNHIQKKNSKYKASEKGEHSVVWTREVQKSLHASTLIFLFISKSVWRVFFFGWSPRLAIAHSRQCPVTLDIDAKFPRWRGLRLERSLVFPVSFERTAELANRASTEHMRRLACHFKEPIPWCVTHLLISRTVTSFHPCEIWQTYRAHHQLGAWLLIQTETCSLACFSKLLESKNTISQTSNFPKMLWYPNWKTSK